MLDRFFFLNVNYGCCCPQLCLLCIDLLLCRRDGEAQGEGTEVRGAGTGHLRTGSSTMLLGSILSIIYSAVREEERRGWRMRSNDRQKGETRRGNEKQTGSTGQSRGGLGMRSMGGGEGETFQRRYSRSIQQHSHQHGKQLVLRSSHFSTDHKQFRAPCHSQREKTAIT